MHGLHDFVDDAYSRMGTPIQQAVVMPGLWPWRWIQRVSDSLSSLMRESVLGDEDRTEVLDHFHPPASGSLTLKQAPPEGLVW